MPAIEYTWYNKNSHPLPPEIANLPSIEATLWKEILPDYQGAVGLEGPIFDKMGNLFFCCNPADRSVDDRIMKISAEGEISVFYYEKGMHITGLAVHRDGRLFGTDLFGKLVILNPDGTEDKIIPIQTPSGVPMMPDDLAFDNKGNLYFTDLRGWIGDPIGGVYCAYEKDGYEKFDLVLGQLCAPNGISFSPDYTSLWIGESARKTLTRIDLLENGRPNFHGGIHIIPVSAGVGIPDSNKVDSDGNVYQAMMKGGRVAVFSPYGTQIANILLPGRDENRYAMSSNLIIKPGTDEGYVVAGCEPGNPLGAAIFKFRAIAPAQTLFSHM